MFCNYGAKTTAIVSSTKSWAIQVFESITFNDTSQEKEPDVMISLDWK